jgi:acetylornithine deacetylase
MIDIDRNYLIHILTDLVRIESINPGLSPDGSGEARAAAYTAEAMRALGLRVEYQQLAPQRANAVGVLPSSGDGPSLMLNAHLDTVGVAGMQRPLSAEIRDGKLYGRGSQDMKGSLAAMLAAVKALIDREVHLKGDLVLAAVADEENESIGTQEVIHTHPTQAAIVTEPTDMQLCLAHRGLVYFAVDVHGKAAHGSRYDLGIDAILYMSRFLHELEKLEADLRQRSPHPLVGPPSLHASTIRGGTEISTYPAESHLEFEWRTIPGDTVQGACVELQSILDRLAAADPKFHAELNVFQARQPHEVSPDAPIVAVVSDVLLSRLGRQPVLTGAPFWTDAALLSEAGIQAVVLGPYGQGLHSEEEWVDLQSCVDLAAVLAETAIKYCGKFETRDFS